MSEGQDKAREIANKLKNEVKEEGKIEAVREKEITQSLATISQNSELVNMYKESASVGSQNLGSSLPMLKIHTTNKSLGNELADGSEPNDGWFFYTKTQEQYQKPICHILTISKGFRAEGMADKKTGQVRKDVFNQILGGVIIDGGDFKPFITYFTGSKLSRLWEFGKEVNKYNHAKPVPIPMFALTVQLSTEKVKNDYGFSPVINFEIQKNEDGFPVVVGDPGEFVFLKDMVESMEDTIASLIASKSTEEAVIVKHNDEKLRDSSGNEVKDIGFEEEGEELKEYV